MFGVVNALFSGLAFAGMIITLKMQKDDLKEAHKEFKLQDQAMKRQRFETTFFNLLTMLEHITDNLECKAEGDIRINPTNYKGKEKVFKFLYKGDDYANINGVKAYLRNENTYDPKEYPFFKVLRKYFPFFEGILKFIDETDLLANKEKLFYVTILRNTLFDNERNIIFYYFAAQGGWYKEMAEKYGLFYGLNSKDLAKEEHYNLFDSSAYEYNGSLS